MNEMSLGDVLVQMGFVTRQEVMDLIDNLTNSSRDDVFGGMMIAQGLISRNQLEEAKKLLASLRGDDKMKRAEAANDLVNKHAAMVASAASTLKVKANVIGLNAVRKKRETHEDNPVITAEMLKAGR